MIIDDVKTTELISDLATIQRHIMRTMLATGEDFDQLQPALQLVIGAQTALIDHLDNQPISDADVVDIAAKVHQMAEGR
jgi:hypothetical protein